MRNKSVALIIALLLVSCDSKKEAKKETPAVPVLATKPLTKDVPIYVESIGLLRSSVFIEVLPQVAGKIKEVFVKEGQWVKKGTPLLIIDPQPYLIKVQEAEAQLSLDKATFEGAQKKLDRFRMLARKDLVAQTEWDELETQSAKAQASFDADTARLSSAKLELENCTINSPIDGRVGKLDIHPGQLIRIGQTASLATIAKLDPLIVEFSVTEKEFPQIKQNGENITIQSLCTNENCSSGVITFLDNSFNQKTGQLLIRGNVTNSDHTLRPGQSVRVKIPVGVAANAKLIPQKAIKYNQQGAYVYVVQADNSVAFRQLTLGDELGKDVIVSEGINEVEPVITDGHLRLYPGLKVEIKQ